MASWSFLTNHARTPLCIAHDPGLRVRDIAVEVGITERSAHGLVADHRGNKALAGRLAPGVAAAAAAGSSATTCCEWPRHRMVGVPGAGPFETINEAKRGAD